MLLVEVYGLYLSWAELQDRQKREDEAAAPSYHISWNKKCVVFTFTDRWNLNVAFKQSHAGTGLKAGRS